MSKHSNYEKLPTISLHVSQCVINKYAAASGDRNPIHLDSEFARNTSFGHIIAHGMLTLSLVDQMMNQVFSEDWSLSGTIKSKFRGAASVGDDIHTVGAFKSTKDTDTGVRLSFNIGVHNTKTNELLVGGTCTVDVPKFVK